MDRIIHPCNLAASAVTVLWFWCAWAEGGVADSVCTHVVSEQMFLWPQNGRRTVAKALPWLNISVTCEGR